MFLKFGAFNIYFPFIPEPRSKIAGCNFFCLWNELCIVIVFIIILNIKKDVF